MAKTPPRIPDNTPEEEARIQSGIAADPDTWEAADAKPRRVGRPSGSDKTKVTLNLDNDVLDALKSPEAKGWQTRANATLRKALKLKA
ncbi:MAG: BrnA antitoxin family protein [Pseudomonadota bacterium]